jgi:hypothetical protein
VCEEVGEEKKTEKTGIGEKRKERNENGEVWKIYGSWKVE